MVGSTVNVIHKCKAVDGGHRPPGASTFKKRLGAGHVELKLRPIGKRKFGREHSFPSGSAARGKEPTNSVVDFKNKRNVGGDGAGGGCFARRGLDFP